MDPLYVGDVVFGGDGGAHALAHLLGRADRGEQRDVAAHAPLARLALAGVYAPRLELDRRLLPRLVGQEPVDRLPAPFGGLQRDEYAVALGEHVGPADAARGRRLQVGGDERAFLLDRRHGHIAETFTPLTSKKSRAVWRNDARAARAASHRNTSAVRRLRLGMPSISSAG